MAGKRKKKVNYLDLCPLRRAEFDWKREENGTVTIFVENKGFFHRLAQMLLHKPKISQVHLETFGSFIWPLADGSRSVYEIACKVKEEFGEQAEPLYERLVVYMKNLEKCGFIQMKAKGQL